ncbi:MAG TPA: hypothetical protein VLG91_21190 [Streptomyces sp.]|nr:hypothetical protein [Streptomyces sp.]
MNTDPRGPEVLAPADRSCSASFAKRRAGTLSAPLPAHDSGTDPRAFTGSRAPLASRVLSGPVTGPMDHADGGIGVRGVPGAADGDDPRRPIPDAR